MWCYSQLGMHFADLPTADLAPGQRIDFTWFWPATHDWEGTDFSVTIADSA
jgi:glucoamylase